MGKIRFIAQSSRSCFRRWKNGPRILILLGMIACFIIIYAIPFAENAKAQGESLQCSEIFIAMMNWRFTMLLFSSAVLLLFGDLPVIERFTANTLICGTRRSWMASQIIYVVATSLLLTAFIFGITFLVALPNLSFSDEWSRPVKLLALSGRIAISPERMRLVMPKSIVTDYTPWQAFGHSFSLFFLMGLFYGLASLVLKMRFRSGGFVLLIIVNAISWATGMFVPELTGYAILSILSVHYHASLYLHENRALNPLLPSLDGSYAILFCTIVIFIVIAMMLVKRYDYVTAEDEQL